MQVETNCSNKSAEERGAQHSQASRLRMEAQEGQKDAVERKRKQKFSQEELQVTVDEIVTHYSQIFGRQSLHVAETVKRNIWLAIQGKVNAIGVTHRDIEDIKKRWYDLRIVTKKKIAGQKKDAGLTGGGRAKAPKLTPLEEQVASTMESECIHGIGDLDSTAKAAKKQGESSRSSAPPREERAAPSKRGEKEKRKSRHSAGEGGDDPTQDPSSPDPPTTPIPMSPLLFGSPDLTNTPMPGGESSQAEPPQRILQTSDSEDEEDVPQKSAPVPDRPRPTMSAGSARTTVLGRRARDGGEGQDGESVFCGLEGTMVKVQRQQAKSLQAMQRQVRGLSATMSNMDKGITQMATSLDLIAQGISDISTYMGVLSDKLDREHLQRARERQYMRQQTKAMNRFAANTALLCRRSISMQEAIEHCCTDLTRGMGRVTSAMEQMLTSNLGNAGDTGVEETEGSTSRSGSSTPVQEVRRSGRHSHAESGTSREPEGQAPKSRNVVRGRKH